MSVEVLLDIYSGRPNPKWRLDPEAAAELGRLFGQAKEKTNDLPQPPALGYRGFHLSATGEAIPSHCTVFEGIVQTESGNVRDKGRVIEKWLIRHSKAHVELATYQYLETLLNK